MDNVRRIQDTVCDAFGITLAEMLAVNRRADIAKPRQIAMYLVRTYTRLSFPQIGTKFCRDHTTIIAGCRQTEIMLGIPANAVVVRHIISRLDLQPLKPALGEEAMREAWRVQILMREGAA